jgi:acyl-CoA synthetase (AMP-forming)/AMP-acid ligase II
MKLISILRGSGRPDEDEVIVGGPKTYTRAEARVAVAKCVQRLRRYGVRPGDRVVAIIEHDASGVFFLAAASALGLRVIMPYNLQSAAEAEWAALADRARPERIVALKPDAAALPSLLDTGIPIVPLAGFEAEAEPPVSSVVDESSEPIEKFLVLFTSGSTSAPKAISVSESVICQRIVNVTQRLSFHADARIFMSGLLNNTTGVIFSFGALYHGATLVFPLTREIGSWPAEVAKHSATHIMLRPVAMRRFLDSMKSASISLDCLQVVAYGAAPLPRPVLEEGLRLLPCQWVQGYGLSETYGPFCWLDGQAHREGRFCREPYCVGVPDGTVEVRLEPLDGHPAAVGEVLIRSSVIMDGYYDVATGQVDAPGEWFRTGDIGAWSAAGDLVLKGRVHRSVLSRNGHRIYPGDVESALAGLPGVDDVTLVAVNGEQFLTERPVVCISGLVATSNREAIRQVVADALQRSLSPEKWPELIYATAEPFPKGANEKVAIKDLLQQLGEEDLISLETASKESRHP